MGVAPIWTSATDMNPSGASPDWNEMVLVGRVARTHGIAGQVVVAPETDFVDERFRAGSRVWAGTGQGPEPLTIRSARRHKERVLVDFEGLTRVEDVEPLAGLELRIPVEELRPLEAGIYYRHQLVGCRVATTAGLPLGEVTRVDGGAGGTLLTVAGVRGEVLVPFAAAICVEIDVERRLITIAPPDGLIELNQPRGSAARLPAVAQDTPSGVEG